MQNNKNFQTVLLAHINNIKDIPLKARLDYFEDDKDDLVINSLSGGVIDKEYMDGTREVSLGKVLLLLVFLPLVLPLGIIAFMLNPFLELLKKED